MSKAQATVFTTATFSKLIEEMTVKSGGGYIDTVTHYCSVNGVEIETAAKLLNKKIKLRIAEEARSNNLLKAGM